MSSIHGLTLLKIDGIFELDVKNARWSTKQSVPQFVTGGGAVTALGEKLPSGSFDEVIAIDGSTEWRNKKDFSIQIYDKETRKKVVFAAEGCNWESVDGSSDQQSATTSRSVSWKGNGVVKI